MELLFTNESFLVDGLPFPGIPFLLDQHMKSVTAVNRYLLRVAIHKGRASARATWATYGRHLYDVFSFFEANNLRWDEPTDPDTPSVLARYRNWSLRINEQSTVNDRLRTAIRFYKDAQEKGLIRDLPWDYEEVSTAESGGFLAHTKGSGNRRETPDILLKEQASTPEVLTKEQLAMVLAELHRNKHHTAITELAIGAGMRRAELMTFPLKYVVNPERYPDCTLFEVKLDPRDMETKGSKERIIHIARRLMRKLWDYAMIDRVPRARLYAKKHGEDAPFLFVSGQGNRYSDTAYNDVLMRVGRKVGFHVHPHLLRHSYASHTLDKIREEKNTGSALVYVRDRLGHQSVLTTEAYLHPIDDVQFEYLAVFQEEIDSLVQAAVRKQQEQ